MILRIENVDTGSFITVSIDEIPKQGNTLAFDGRMYTINNIIEFTSHHLAICNPTEIVRIFPHQIIGVDNETGK